VCPPAAGDAVCSPITRVGGDTLAGGTCGGADYAVYRTGALDLAIETIDLGPAISEGAASWITDLSVDRSKIFVALLRISPTRALGLDDSGVVWAALVDSKKIMGITVP